jgi:hypothetical protein
VEITAISEICKMSVSVCFVSEGHITQLTVIIGQAVIERNVI